MSTLFEAQTERTPRRREKPARGVSARRNRAVQNLDALSDSHFWREVLTYGVSEDFQRVVVTGYNIRQMAAGLCRGSGRLSLYALTQILERDEQLAGVLHTARWKIVQETKWDSLEISEIKPTFSTLAKLQELLAPLVGLDSTALMKKALLAEYGRILPELDNCVFTTTFVNLQDIDTPNSKRDFPELQRQWRESGARRYPHSNTEPLALVYRNPVDGRMRLIDGRHRISSLLEARKIIAGAPTGKMLVVVATPLAH